MSKKCLNGFEMSKAESLIVEFFNNADAVQVEEGTWYYSESSVNSELLEVYEQLAKSNERVKRYEKEAIEIAKAQEKFAIEKKIEALSKFKTISGAVANHWCDKEQKGYLWLHSEILAEIEKLEQLRKEQNQC